MFFSKLDKYSNELVREVGTSHKISVYWFANNFCWTVKYHYDFARLVGTEDTMIIIIITFILLKRNRFAES